MKRESGPSSPHSPENATEIREHLANERTLLSWMRTGVNAISVGILLYVVVGVLDSLPEGSLLGDFSGKNSRSDEFALFGIGLVVFGAFVELAATARFIQYRRSISRGSFTSPTLVYLHMVLGLVLVGVAYIGYVVVG